MVFLFKKVYLEQGSENEFRCMKIKKFLKYYYRSIFIFLLIFFASIIPASEVKKVTFFNIPNFDKLVHLGMYFMFSFVLIFDLIKAKQGYSYRKIYFFTAITALIYGGSLEIVQATLTRSRTGDLFDFFFNSAGVMLAIALWLVLRKPK
jgi:hypothetical protein